MLDGFASFLEKTSVALAIRDSVVLTGSLSGLHLVGMTLVGGSALVAGLAASGTSFGKFVASDVARATRRGIGLGVTISIGSGLLLFAPRASTAIASPYFQFKMLLLAAALTLHLTAIARRGERTNRWLRTFAAVLWFGVILAGSAYILLEG